jgi:NRPS condensation-like uncharacterized protein
MITFKNSSSGSILFKCDHFISDGLGLIGLICSIADNYSEDVSHSMLRFKKITFIYELFEFILSPFY